MKRNQFQAMASKLCLSDIKDFINLTFCCQQATVVAPYGVIYDNGMELEQIAIFCNNQKNG